MIIRYTRSFAAALAATALSWGLPSLAESVRGSGTPATETRPVSGIQSLGLSVAGRVEVIQGDVEKLTISADDNVLPLIETVVERGELRIRFKERNVSLSTRTPIKVTLQVKSLDGISVAGSGDVQAPGLSAKAMKVSISGSGDVTLGGKADSLDVHISGSGNVRAGKFESQSANVSIAGSGDTTVNARENLKVSIAGSGDVRYYGDPKVQRSVAGSGSVRRAGATPG